VAREIYAHLGGGSPLLANTRAQAAALEAALAKPMAEQGTEARVFIAMRYWHPFAAATAREVAAWKPSRILLLPLYPQYSTTTTESSIADWRRAAAAAGLAAATRTICCYPTEPGFIAAAAELARAGLAEAARLKPGIRPKIIFTAHGLPKKIAESGDPYVGQVRATCLALAAALGLREGEWELGFQSRVGPLEWVGPATDALILTAARAGQPILLLPVAFVSEHSETLVELDIEYRRLAAAAGGEVYVRVPTVATHPAFIAGLAGLVGRALAGSAPILGAGCPPAATRCPRRAALRGNP
jgi:protoporphyrin/coproporphyrin ferrochelatase